MASEVSTGPDSLGPRALYEAGQTAEAAGGAELPAQSTDQMTAVSAGSDYVHSFGTTEQQDYRSLPGSVNVNSNETGIDSEAVKDEPGKEARTAAEAREQSAPQPSTEMKAPSFGETESLENCGADHEPGGEMRYHMLSTMRPKDIITTHSAEMPGSFISSPLSREQGGNPSASSDTQSLASDRPLLPFPSPSDEDVRHFVLATGGGFGAADSDSRFVIGGEWRETKPKRGKWFSLRNLQTAHRKSDEESSDRRPSTLMEDAGSARTDEGWEQKGGREHVRFYRPELGSAGHSQKFRLYNAAELEDKLRSSGRRMEGDLEICLQRLDNVPFDAECVQIEVSLGAELPLEPDVGQSRVFGRRQQSLEQRHRVRLDVQVRVIRAGGGAEKMVTGTLWAHRENVREDRCDVLLVEGSTVSVALLGREVRRQEDALTQYGDLLQGAVTVGVSVGAGRFGVTESVLETTEATLEDILHVDTLTAHQTDYAMGRRTLGGATVQFRARRMCYDRATIRELGGAEAVHRPANGRLAWRERDNVEPASYVRVPTEGLPGWEETNPFLVRFLMERVWRMPRPRLIFSVTGGAKDFNMTNNKKDRLMLGLIEAAKAMDAWVITSGTSEGVMKLVGEARARFAVSVPLIGVTTWGTVAGRHKLVERSRDNQVTRQHSQLTPVEDYAAGVKEHRSKFKDPQRRWQRERLTEGGGDDSEPSADKPATASGRGMQVPRSPVAGKPPLLVMRQRSTQSLVQAAKGWTELDQNHSHFVLVQDGTSGLYAREVKFRGHLESCLAEEDGRTNEIMASLRRLGMGWQGVDMSDVRTTTQPTPAVCVCVQGGPGTVSTVMHAVLNETPVLLVKGSGNAADLIADAVLLRFGVENSRQLASLSDNQRALSSLISSHVRQESSLSGLCKDYTALIEALEEPKAPLALAAQAIVARYFEKVPSGGLCRMLSKVLRAAQTGMCWIYDLNADDGGSSDFSGSLLKCLVHGQRQKLREDSRQQLERDLQMVIAWDRKDILEQVLEKAVAKTTASDMHAATSAALHSALLSNRVELVRVLLNHGASLAGYSVQEDKVMQREHTEATDMEEEDDDDEATEQLQAVRRWIQLLQVHKLEGNAASSHLRSMLMPLKLASRQADWLAAVSSALLPARLAALWSQKPTYKQRYRALMMAGRALKSEIRTSSAEMPVATLGHEWVQTKKFLLKMRWLYRDLLGEGFRYHLGATHPHLDLLLWSVVMNRQELALLFWRAHSRTPMQTALSCALLYRKMAARSEVEPVMQKRMLESGREFEKLAVGVQQAAMDSDVLQALEAVEFPLDLWESGATAVDLAVAGGSMTFLELCCREALDRRFAGDLHPYGQQIGWIRGGCKRAALICVFTGGLLAPFVIKFVPPPVAENLRYSTQFRSMPEGFPLEPLHNKTLSRIFARYKAGKPLRRAELKAVSWVTELGRGAHAREGKLGSDQLGELWDPTFGYWEKLICFWRAPVTIYLTNVVVQVVVLVLFTNFLAADARAVRAEEWHAFEYFLVLYFAAACVTESLQVLLDGLASYIQDFWNCIDVLSLTCFWVAVFYRSKCMQAGQCDFMNDNKWMSSPYQRTASLSADDIAALIRSGRVLQDQDQQAAFEMNGMSKLFYALSLFLLWTRLLRILSVDKTLGPLVLVLRRMGRDALNFGVMWAVLLMAFSVALHGTGVAAGGECDREGGDYEGECWEAWWVIRTYFQALSQPFFEEMTNYAAMLFLMFSWVTMNIVMVNLLIARMSSTYSRIEKQSEKEWMLDRYLATNEYMRHTTSIPVPFNVFPLLLDLVFFVFLQVRAWLVASKQNAWELDDSSGFSLTSRLTQHLSRSKRKPPSRSRVKDLRTKRDALLLAIASESKSAGGSPIKHDKEQLFEESRDEGGSRKHDKSSKEFQRLSRLITLEETALMRENKQRLRINAFMESSRAEYMKRTHMEVASQSRIDRVEDGMKAILSLFESVDRGVDSNSYFGLNSNSASANSELENITNMVNFTQSIHTRNGFI